MKRLALVMFIASQAAQANFPAGDQFSGFIAPEMVQSVVAQVSVAPAVPMAPAPAPVAPAIQQPASKWSYDAVRSVVAGFVQDKYSIAHDTIVRASAQATQVAANVRDAAVTKWNDLNSMYHLQNKYSAARDAMRNAGQTAITWVSQNQALTAFAVASTVLVSAAYIRAQRNKKRVEKSF